jgi:hypothetical protein
MMALALEMIRDAFAAIGFVAVLLAAIAVFGFQVVNYGDF